MQVLSRIAANRLQKELTEWQLSAPSGFKHKVTDSLQRYEMITRDSFCSTLVRKAVRYMMQFASASPFAYESILQVEV